MKKHFYSILFLLTAYCGNISAQCSIDGSVTSGIAPVSNDIPCINQNDPTPTSIDFTFVIPGTVSGFTIDSFHFSSIGNLPSGLTYAFSNSPATYLGGSQGCFNLNGTTNDACGQYKMLINVTIYVSGMFPIPPITGELGALAAQYSLPGFEPIYLRLKDTAGTCPAVNNNGNNFTADQSCGIAGGVASAVTDPATSINQTIATLNGTVNPNGSATTVTFEYGTTTAYGTSVPLSPIALASGSTAVPVSHPLTGLLSNRTYHYRVVAVNSGGTTEGNDQIFRTLSPPGACTPNTAQTTPFDPQPADFKCTVKATNFNETLFLSMPALTALLPVPIDSIRFDSIGNLPAGLIALPNQNDNTYSATEYGCIQFSGNTNTGCGQYRVKLYLSIFTATFGTISGELSALAAQYGFALPSYYIRVTSCPSACDTIDNAAADIKTVTCPTSGTIAQPSIIGSSSFCAGNSISLSVSGGTYNAYKWSTGASSQSISVSQANTYSVTVKSGCDSATTSKTITQLPSPNVSIGQSGNTLSVPSDPASNYQWLKDGSPIGGANSASYTATSSGNYSVDVTKGSCRDTSSIITKNFIGIEGVSGLESLSIVPNPAKDLVTIGIKSAEAVKAINLMDVYGKLLKTVSMNNTEVNQTIQIGDLSSGMYFIQITTMKGTVTKTILKQ